MSRNQTELWISSETDMIFIYLFNLKIGSGSSVNPLTFMSLAVFKPNGTKDRLKITMS